jgi:hypothetical protein
MDILIRNMDPNVWKEFREWCIRQGIPISGRNARMGEVISQILMEKVRGETKPPRGDNKLKELKETLDRNIKRLGKQFIQPAYLESLISSAMGIRTPHLIRSYARMCGYPYDRSRKAYINPAPAPITPDEEKEVNNLLKYATDPRYHRKE